MSYENLLHLINGLSLKLMDYDEYCANVELLSFRKDLQNMIGEDFVVDSNLDHTLLLSTKLVEASKELLLKETNANDIEDIRVNLVLARKLIDRYSETINLNNYGDPDIGTIVFALGGEKNDD